MRILLSILLIISPILGHAQLSTNNKVAAFNRTEGAVVYENYALNQSFDKNLVGVSTPTGGTASIVTTSGVKLFGKGSLQFAVTSTGQLTAIRSKPFPIGLNGQTCQTKFTYATPYGGAVTRSEFSYFVTNSSGTKISATATLPATFDIAGTQQSKTAVVFYPCPYNSVTPANSWVELTIEHIGSASTSIIIDEKFDMVANDIGSGVPNNVFSANIAATSGTISNENVDWISGSASTTGTKFTLTLNAGYDATTLGCLATTNQTSTSASNTYNVYATNATTLVVEEYASTSATAVVNASVYLECKFKGSAFIQPAITPNQWNSELKSAGAITIGATTTAPTKGTVSNDLIQWGRKGDLAIIRGIYKQTAGGAGGSGDYLFTLPNGMRFNSNKVTYFTTVVGANGVFPNSFGIGSATASDTISQAVGFVVPYDATRFRIGWVRANSTSGADRGAISATQFGLGGQTSFSFDFFAPIEGWTENQNAPQLLGSLTSNSSNAYRSEFATINNNGTCSIVSSSSGFTSTSKTATGQCSTVVSFGVTPTMCSCTGMRASGPTTCTFQNAVSATSMLTLTQASAADSDQNFYVECKIPR